MRGTVLYRDSSFNIILTSLYITFVFKLEISTITATETCPLCDTGSITTSNEVKLVHSGTVSFLIGIVVLVINTLC